MGKAPQKISYKLQYGMSASTEDGVIKVEAVSITHELTSRVALWQLNTFDALVRAELIKLGWTPPPDEEKRDDDNREDRL